ncbi:MAG TPA: IS5 family transposase [Terracidiphilus sp.]|jgi:transposase|nr:IS5 family transposase [Terracidiphilus sp.]
MYPSDLTDAQWLELEPLLRQLRVQRHGGGRPRKYELRRIVDAMFNVVKTGCRWRQMSVNFPPWGSVYQQFRQWRDTGTWERVVQALREQGRTSKGRKATPAVAIIDSQSAKTALKGGSAATTRHIAVHTQGNLLAVMVHSAGIRDRAGARAVMMRLFRRFDTIAKIFVDGCYTGKLIGWARDMFVYDV